MGQKGAPRMRGFDYTRLHPGLLTQRTMDLLAAVHECRGRQASDLAVGRDVLDALRALNPDAMTPMDALKLLSDWKALWGSPSQ